MNTLYCLSLGETKRNEFIEEAQQYAYGEALFVVPGNYFRQLVKKQGTVRTVIMDYLPNEILRLNAKEKVYQRISRPAQEMLLKNIMQEMLETGKLTYFEPLALRDGFVKNLAAFIGELSRSGVAPEELSRAFAAWDNRPVRLQEKDKELTDLYSTYRERLQTRNLYDVDGLYRLAINMLETGTKSLPWKTLYFSEFYQFDDLQRDLLRALSKYCHIKIGIFYDGQRPELSKATLNAYGDLAGMNFQLVKEPAVVKRRASLSFLVDNWQKMGHKKIKPQNISLLEAASPENEMAGVITSIKNLLATGVNPQNIVVLVRSLADYAGFSDLFHVYGVPTSLPQVTSFSGQALPDFLVKLLKTAVNISNVENWQNLLATEFAGTLFHIDREKLEEAYNTKFFSTENSLLSFLKTNFPQADIEEILAVVKDLGKKQTGNEFVKKISDALEQWNISGLAGKAYQENSLKLAQIKILAGCENFCQKILQDMELAFAQSGNDTTKISVEEFLALWLDMSKDATITLQKGNPKGIQVLEVANVQALTFTHVFLMGLREGVFPKIKFENWLYNDKERAVLHDLDINLQQTSANVATDRYFFGTALAMATEELHISYYADDTAGPSGYIEELGQYFQPDTWHAAKFSVSKANCAAKEELLKILAQAPEPGKRETQWLENEVGTDFSLKKTVDRKRWLLDSPYNGKIGGKEEIPSLSASSLDLYVECPFKYLVSKEWKTAIWEPLTEEIKPTVSGDLYHLTLARFLGKHLQEDLSTLDKKALTKELLTDFQKEYTSLVQKGLIAETPLGLQEKKFYWSVLVKWLEVEIGYQSDETVKLLPSQLEIGFGLANSKWPALKLTFDNKVTAFSGQIDRIDTDGKNYIITDYKSGSFPSGTDIVSGKALQLPLYVLALENLCHINKDNIWGAGYYALQESKRKSGMWNKEKEEALPWLSSGRSKSFGEVMEKAMANIAIIVQSIRKGSFPANPWKKCPAYCPGYDICRYRLNTVLNLSEEGENNE
jgi:ATP-dependent helicase/nuclease subunit B